MVIMLFSLLLISCQNKEPLKSNEKPVQEEIEVVVEKVDENNKDIREVVWESLSKSEQEEVVGSWKEAKVRKAIANAEYYALTDKSYAGKEVTMVTFHSKNYQLLGDIIKLVDEKSGKVVGAGFRE